ncbi:hypothetical protein [Streptomyces sp. NPDC003327]
MRECAVIRLGQGGAVERLAPLTGACPVPAAKQARGYRYDPDY